MKRVAQPANAGAQLRTLAGSIWGLLLTSAVVVTIVVSVYSHYMPGQISDQDEHWARFGEYLGGTLGPVFGFLAFVGVLLTLWVQSKQHDETSRALNEQRDSIQLQNFESTFFELLRLYNEIVRGIDLRRS